MSSFDRLNTLRRRAKIERLNRQETDYDNRLEDGFAMLVDDDLHDWSYVNISCLDQENYEKRERIEL